MTNSALPGWWIALIQTQDEHMGASLCFLPEGTDAEIIFFAPSLVLYIVGYCRPRTFPHHHRIVLPRSAGRKYERERQRTQLQSAHSF